MKQKAPMKHLHVCSLFKTSICKQIIAIKSGSIDSVVTDFI